MKNEQRDWERLTELFEQAREGEVREGVERVHVKYLQTRGVLAKVKGDKAPDEVPSVVRDIERALSVEEDVEADAVVESVNNRYLDVYARVFRLAFAPKGLYEQMVAKLSGATLDTICSGKSHVALVTPANDGQAPDVHPAPAVKVDQPADGTGDPDWRRRSDEDADDELADEAQEEEEAVDEAQEEDEDEEEDEAGEDESEDEKAEATADDDGDVLDDDASDANSGPGRCNKSDGRRRRRVAPTLSKGRPGRKPTQLTEGQKRAALAVVAMDRAAGAPFYKCAAAAGLGKIAEKRALTKWFEDLEAMAALSSSGNKRGKTYVAGARFDYVVSKLEQA